MEEITLKKGQRKIVVADVLISFIGTAYILNDPKQEVKEEENTSTLGSEEDGKLRSAEAIAFESNLYQYLNKKLDFLEEQNEISTTEDVSNIDINAFYSTEDLETPKEDEKDSPTKLLQTDISSLNVAAQSFIGLITSSAGLYTFKIWKRK